MYLEIAMCLPRETETVGLMRSAITNSLVLFGVSDDCVEDIRLAVSEACTNVIKHAAHDDEYEVRVRLDDDECEISVTNAGNGFDFSALTDVMPDPLSAQGRGVAIMRAVMDRVDFASGAEHGTIVKLVRRLPAREHGASDRRRRGAPPRGPNAPR